MSSKPSNILDEVILGYRKLIDKRYRYERLKKHYDIPDSFDEARVDLYRNYFLDYLYPTPEKRKELDGAFKSLDSYIAQPNKLLRVLVDSSWVLFKYGRHVPRILQAGIKAFRSFRAATDFEAMLVRKAKALNLEAPYDEAEMNKLIAALPLREVDKFIDYNRALFEVLYDRSLIRDIANVIEHLIGVMRKRPKVYSPDEINGLEVGLEMIRMGDKLFDQLSKEDQQRIFDLIVQIELDAFHQFSEEGK